MAQKYLGFPVPDDLHARVEEIICEIRKASNKKQYALPLFEVVSELSDVGLHYFFIQSLRRVKIGRIKMMAVENAIRIGKKAILSVGKSIIKTMNNEQLSVLVDVLEEFILPSENL